MEASSYSLLNSDSCFIVSEDNQQSISTDTTVLVGAEIIFRYSIIIVSVGWMTVLLVCCVAILVIIAIVITTVYIISYRQRQKKKHNFGIKKFKSSVRCDNG